MEPGVGVGDVENFGSVTPLWRERGPGGSGRGGREVEPRERRGGGGRCGCRGVESLPQEGKGLEAKEIKTQEGLESVGHRRKMGVHEVKERAAARGEHEGCG